MAKRVEPWWLYVLVGSGHRAATARTYVGITDDLTRRLAQHNGSLPGGARATRAWRPWKVAGAAGPFDTRGEATSAEHRLKRLRGVQRVAVVNVAVPVRPSVRPARTQYRLFRAAAPDDARAEFKRISGTLALAVGGTLAATLWGGSIAVRLSPGDWVRAATRGGLPFAKVGRSVTRDVIVLRAGTLEDPKLAAAWLEAAVDYTATLRVPEHR